MKRLLIILFSTTLTALAQAPDYAAYVLGNAEVNAAAVTFYFENVSDCQLDTVNVRVAHNSVYLTTDETSLNVSLAPEEVGTFVMNLSRVASSDWQWAIDGVGLSNCDEAGQKDFEKISFGEGLPLPSETTTTGSELGSVVYTIERGDTLFQIAEKFGVTARAIMDANGLENEALIYGRTLQIPASSTAATSTSGTSGNFALHTVTTGDTLYSLSQQYNTTVSLIQDANCLAPDSVLIVGNQLRIPPTGVTEIAEACN